MKKKKKGRRTQNRRGSKDLSIQKLNMVKRSTTIEDQPNSNNLEIRKAKRIIKKEKDHMAGRENPKERARSKLRHDKLKNQRKYLMRISNHLHKLVRVGNLLHS